MALKVWNPVTTGKLSVKPAQNQPKLVVTNKPSPSKVTVTPTAPQPKLTVGANFGMQGTTYNPQKTAPSNVLQAPVTPQRTAVNVLQNTYNPNTGNIDSKISVQMLTESEREKALIASRISAQIKNDIDELRKQLGGSANYKNELYKYNQQIQADLANSFQSIYKDFQKANGEINQLRNNAKTEEERKFYDEQIKANDKQWKEWQFTQSVISNQTNTQIRVESEKSRISAGGRVGQVLGATSGFLHSKGVGRFNLGNLWKYTLGSGTEAIPSLVSIPTRAVKFGQNVIDPNREMEYEDERRSGLPKGDKTSVGDRWRATSKQKIFNEAIFDDVGTGPVENFANNLSTWGKGIGINKSPEFYAGFASFITDEFADISNYIGAGTVSKITKAVGKADTVSDATKAVSKILKPLQESFQASKVGKVASYPFKKYTPPSKVRADASAEFYAKQSKDWDDVKRLYKEGKADVAQTKKVAEETQNKIWKEFNDRWTSTYPAQGNINKALTWSKTASTRNQVAGDIQEFIEKGTYNSGRYSDAQNEIIMRTAEKLRAFTRDLEKFDAEHGIKYVRGRRANYLPQRGSQWKTKPKKDFKETDYTQTRTKTRKVGSYKGQKKGNVAREMAGYRKAQTGGYEKFTQAKAKAEKLKAESATFKKTNYKKNPDRVFGIPVSQKTSKIARAINPINIWKKGVLTYNPAWRVNNEVSNLAQTITRAGPGAVTKQFKRGQKLQKYKLSAKQRQELLGVSVDGKIPKGLNGQESRARVGLYLELRSRGMGHNNAMRDMNRTLGDYGALRNIERPIKAILPFYQWQKHVTKTIATMPVRNPRGASVWSGAYQGLYEKPLSQLPDETQVTTDPETGEKIEYNPREAMKGKLYNPISKEWMNTPFNMMTPEALTNLGINPLITAFNEWNTGKDKYGKNLSDQQWWESITRRFPQYNVAKAIIDANRQEGGMLADKFGEIKNKDQWLALDSGFPKEVQGYDKDAPNYTDRLNAGKSRNDKIRSFFGVPNEVGFDENKFRATKKANDFKKEWFGIDWDKKYPEYEDKNKAQEELAKKYGYDLQKDVYGTSTSTGLFNKNDAPFTKSVKKQKEEARAFTTGFWEQYNQQPKGTRTKWTKAKMAEWEKTDAFRNNPEVTGLPKDWMRQYQTAEDIAYGKKRLAEARAIGLAKYRASPKGQFWEKYLSMPQGSKERAKFYNENYKEEYGGKKSDPAKKKERQEKTEFWLNYFASNPQEQKKLAEANPQYFKKLAPRTSDQINADRLAKRDEMTGILNKTANWSELVATQKRGINKDVRRFTDKVAKSRKVIWKI